MTLDAPVSVGSEESPVIRWLMTDGRRITDPKSFLENFAMCLIEAGVDVSRITTGVPVLHPQVYSYSGLWERGKGVTERLYRADASQDALANGPPHPAYHPMNAISARAGTFRAGHPPPPSASGPEYAPR